MDLLRTTSSSTILWVRSLISEPGNASRIMRAFGAYKRLIIPAKGRDGQRTGLQEGRRTESIKSVSHLLLLKT